MTSNLRSVPAFVASSGFTPGQVRWWIHKANENGLQELGAVVRIGRRVFLDLDAFDRWIDSQRSVTA